MTAAPRPVVWLVIVGQRYEIEAVGETREEAVELAREAWTRHWDLQSAQPFYASFEEALDDGEVRVIRLEAGRAHVDWEGAEWSA